MNHCLHCKKETSNPKFCSKSCAASYNNKLFPKRKPEHKCKSCNASITSSKRLCEDCSNRNFNWLSKTLAESIVPNAGHPSWNYCKVRSYARSYFRKHNPKPSCQVCGYDKHVEVCHIKPISDFPLESLLSEVNSLDNLIGLCPNHHWELDNRLLDFPEFDSLHSEDFPNEAQ